MAIAEPEREGPSPSKDLPAAPAPPPLRADRRKHNERFRILLLLILAALFVALMVTVSQANKPEVLTLIGGWGGTVLAMLGIIVGYEFGSSRGSQLKDESDRRPPAAA
jgi:hypothetical protein